MEINWNRIVRASLIAGAVGGFAGFDVGTFFGLGADKIGELALLGGVVLAKAQDYIEQGRQYKMQAEAKLAELQGAANQGKNLGKVAGVVA